MGKALSVRVRRRVAAIVAVVVAVAVPVAGHHDMGFILSGARAVEKAGDAAVKTGSQANPR